MGCEELILPTEKLKLKIYEKDGRTDVYSFSSGDYSGDHDHMWIEGKNVGYRPKKG